MMRSRPSQIGALLGAVALLVGSCSEDGGGSADTSVPGSTAPASTAPVSDGVTVLKDVEYETGEVTNSYLAPLMDVYAPAEAEGLPLVVLLHGGGVTKDSLPVYDTVPRAIAARGAVVVVPNWSTGSTELPNLLDAVAVTRCAIGFAVEHASEWGADPDAVTLVGHSAGANNAAVVAFDPAPQPPGCPARTWDLDGVMVWEGDWVLATPEVWDVPGSGVADAIPVVTPWAVLDGWSGPVTFVVTTGGIEGLRRCDDIDTWLPVRDPTGSLRTALDAVGATDDGCIDPGDLSKALAFAMTEAGVANTYVELTGSNHTQLSSDDLELMADEVYALAAPRS